MLSGASGLGAGAGPREGRGQQLTLSGAQNLALTLYNCEGCTVNGVPLEHLLSAYNKERAHQGQQGGEESHQGEAKGAGDHPVPVPGGGRITKRRQSEILLDETTSMMMDNVGSLDDVATNIKQAVQETILTSGRSGLQNLHDAADELKRILVTADQRVASLSDRLSELLQLTDDEHSDDGSKGSGDAEKGGYHRRVRRGSSRSGSGSGVVQLARGRSFSSPSAQGLGEGGTHPHPQAGQGQGQLGPMRSKPNPLEQIFPKKIVEALSCDVGDDVAEHHPSVTVLMSDIVGFTAWCSEVSPTKVIECLSSYFQVIDDLAETFGVYKVETVGDGYQAITGAPVYSEDHAEVMSAFALKVIETLPTMRKIFDHADFDVRVGINSGPIVTGVIRADRIRWQLFGDTVNVASRMESTSVPGRIQISKSTRDLLLFRDSFTVEKRGLIDIKGKGQQETFFLTGTRTNEIFRSKSTRKSVNLLSEYISYADKAPAGDAGAAGKAGGDGQAAGGGSSGGGASPGAGLLAPAGAEGPAGNGAGSPALAEAGAAAERAGAAPGAAGPEKGAAGAVGAPGEAAEEAEEAVTTVLLVDDLLSILLQYTRVLQREGIKVVTARNGLEGLEHLRNGTKRFTCCFCDIHMPKMDGIDMVKAYREWEQQNLDALGGRRLPLFALTGNTDLDRNTKTYLAAGFDEVISKTNYKEVVLSYVQNCKD